MKRNLNEISALIKEQIKQYEHKVELLDTGKVLSIGDGVAMVYGLKNAMLSELVLFKNDVYGMILNIQKNEMSLWLEVSHI